MMGLLLTLLLAAIHQQDAFVRHVSIHRSTMLTVPLSPLLSRSLLSLSGSNNDDNMINIKASDNASDIDSSNKDNLITSSSRRRLLQYTASLASLTATPALAADEPTVGNRLFSLVTQSDLGLSVRKSIVQGAQVMDQIDGQWESLSNRFNLGYQRSQLTNKPVPKIIPPLGPLDTKFATRFVQICDEAFCNASKISATDLQARVQKVANTVERSYARSGLTRDELDVSAQVTTSRQFNYLSYVHFKAYSDIVVAQRIDFKPFQREFENKVGDSLAALSLCDCASIQPISASEAAANPAATLKRIIYRIENILDVWIQRGLVAQIDPANVEEWNTQDDWTWSIGIDGDASMPAQMLLQELGWRLYPSYGRFVVQALLRRAYPNLQVDVTDYYLDTDYSTDPNQYEPKEVLLNVIISN
jgi:hypothetical protein